jgi:hypothetical protein
VPIRRLLIAAAILLMHGQSAKALLLWNWSYSGAGVSASGAFTTNDAPDAAGFYRIVGITGTDNGATITGIQPTGTPIPGNELYAVNNLVSAVEPRLTAHGFGCSLANGDYANSFYNGSNYFEYLSVPPYKNGAGPERPVSFSAAIVPEPSAASLMLAGLVGLIGFGRILNRRTNCERNTEMTRLYQLEMTLFAGNSGLFGLMVRRVAAAARRATAQSRPFGSGELF